MRCRDCMPRRWLPWHTLLIATYTVPAGVCMLCAVEPGYRTAPHALAPACSVIPDNMSTVAKTRPAVSACPTPFGARECAAA